MSWTPVCKLDDLVPETGACALINDQQIAIFRSRHDELFAIGNYDPIGKANVLSRGIMGEIEGTKVVASPLYKQHFSLTDGHCLEDNNNSVPAYSVRLEQGMVEISI